MFGAKPKRAGVLDKKAWVFVSAGGSFAMHAK